MLDDIEPNDLSVAKFCLVLFNKHSFGEIQILRLGLISSDETIYFKLMILFLHLWNLFTPN